MSAFGVPSGAARSGTAPQRSAAADEAARMQWQPGQRRAAAHTPPPVRPPVQPAANTPGEPLNPWLAIPSRPRPATQTRTSSTPSVQAPHWRPVPAQRAASASTSGTVPAPAGHAAVAPAAAAVPPPVLNIWKPRQPTHQHPKPQQPPLAKPPAMVAPAVAAAAAPAVPSMAPRSVSPFTAPLPFAAPAPRSATDLLRATATRRVQQASPVPASLETVVMDDDDNEDVPITSLRTPAPPTRTHSHTHASPASGSTTAANAPSAFAAAGRVFPAFRSTPRAQRSKHFALTQAAASSSSTGLTQPAAAISTARADEESKEDEDDDEDSLEKCAICTYPLNDLAVLPCCHYYCLPCISEWFQISTACPLCKAATTQLQHFLPPLIPQKANPLAGLFVGPADTGSHITLIADASNPLTAFISRCIASFRASNPSVTLESHILPIEELSSKPRLGLDGHEVEDYELASRIAQEYDAFRIEAEDSSEAEEDFVCVFCNEPSRPDVLLLCDLCDLGYHTFCLDPPLTRVPEGDWFCPDCLTQTEREIREEQSQQQRVATNPFYGGPSATMMRTPPRSARRRGEPGSGVASAERLSRIRIYVRRTLEREDRQRRIVPEDAWAARPVPAAASSSSSSLPRVSWGSTRPVHALQQARSKVQSFSSLFGPSSVAHFQPTHKDASDESEVDYDEYGRPITPKRKRASAAAAAASSSHARRTSPTKKTSTKVASKPVRRRVEYKPSDDEQALSSAKDDDDDDYRSERDDSPRRPSKPPARRRDDRDADELPQAKKAKQQSSSKQPREEPDDDEVIVLAERGPRRHLPSCVTGKPRGSPQKKSPSPKKPTASRSRKRARRISSSSDDLGDFIDDAIRPATPSSDSDGAKAAFLPSQRDNKQSRHTKLALARDAKATAEAAKNHRAMVMSGRRRQESSSSSDSTSSSSLTSDSSDVSSVEETRKPSHKKRRREPVVTRPRTKSTPPPSKQPLPKQQDKSSASSNAHTSNRRAQEAADDDGDSLEDISSFENTQEKMARRQYALDQDDDRQQQTAPSSLSRLSSPVTTDVRTILRTASRDAPAAQRSISMSDAVPKRSSSNNASASKSYRLPLQSFSSTKQPPPSKRGRTPTSDESARDAPESDDGGPSSSPHGHRSNPSSGDERPAPSSSVPGPRQVRKSFVKQTVAGTRSKFFAHSESPSPMPSSSRSHATPIPSRRWSAGLDASFVIPETPESTTGPIESTLPTSGQTTPEASRTVPAIDLVSPTVISPTPSPAMPHGKVRSLFAGFSATTPQNNRHRQQKQASAAKQARH